MRAAIAVVLWAGVAWVTAAQAATRPRLVLDQDRVPVDAPVWICAQGAPHPPLIQVDGFEEVPRTLAARPAGGDAPRRVHLALAWPARGPLDLLSAIDRRPRTRELPVWGFEGTLGPGTYVLSANGFRAETLWVRWPSAAESRGRGLLARARLHAEAGDSALAARLLERSLELDPGSPYAEATFLALIDLWPFTRYRQRPQDWLAEWVARHHASCGVGEGYRRWLARAPAALAGPALEDVVMRYPQTRAAEAASEWLAPP